MVLFSPSNTAAVYYRNVMGGDNDLCIGLLEHTWT